MNYLFQIKLARIISNQRTISFCWNWNIKIIIWWFLQNQNKIWLLSDSSSSMGGSFPNWPTGLEVTDFFKAKETRKVVTRTTKTLSPTLCSKLCFRTTLYSICMICHSKPCLHSNWHWRCWCLVFNFVNQKILIKEWYTYLVLSSARE